MRKKKKRYRKKRSFSDKLDALDYRIILNYIRLLKKQLKKRGCREYVV